MPLDFTYFNEILQNNFTDFQQTALNFIKNNKTLTATCTITVILCTLINQKNKSLRKSLSNIRNAENSIIPYKLFLGHAALVSADLNTMYEAVEKTIDFHRKNYPEEHSLVIWYSPLKPVIYVYTAEGVAQIVKKKEWNEKSFFYTLLHNWLGNGLLTSKGEHWSKRRKILTPAFHFNILENFIQVMNKHARIMVKKMIEDIEKSETGVVEIEIHEKVALSALDIICEAAMGQDLKIQDSEQGSPGYNYSRTIVSSSQKIMKRLNTPWLWPKFIHDCFSDGRVLTEEINSMKAFTAKIIKNRIAQRKKSEKEQSFGNKQLAFLDILLENYENGEIDYQGVCDEVETFMFEGHDTTSSGMAFMVHLLGNDHRVQEKLQNELDEKLTDTNLDNFEIDKNDLESLCYMESSARESMRVFPPVPFVSRKHPSISGADVMIGINFILTETKNWAEPEKFRPERFLEENVKRHPLAFMSFSAGYRNCIGQRFALMEMKVQMAFLFKFLDVESVQSSESLKIEAPLILRSQEALRVRISKRK